MSKPNKKRRVQQAARTPGALLRGTALAILLTLAGGRLLLTESLEPPWEGMVAGTHWPAASTSIAFSALIVLAGLLWAVAQLRRPRPIVAAWALPWLGLLAIGMAVAWAGASNKAAARNGTIPLLALPASFWLLVQLLATRTIRMVALVVLLAAGGLFAARAVQQSAHENRWFIEQQWPQQRAEFYRSQGWDIDDPPAIARQFEERIASAEVKGFAINSNAAAAALILFTLAAAGWAIGKWTAPPAPLRRVWAGLAGALSAGGLAALLLTGSRGGVLSGIAALGLFALVGLTRRWLVRRWKLAVGTAAGLVVIAAIGVAAFCVTFEQPGPESVWYRSGPRQSLLVRWHYWTGAAEVVGDEPVTGVGPGNFRSHYLQHKRPQALEQVEYAHNFAVHSLVEFGPAGALGLVGLLAWMLLSLARPGPDEPPADAPPPPPGRRWLGRLLWATPLGAIGVLVVLPTLLGDGSIATLAGNIYTHFLTILLAPALILLLVLSNDRFEWPMAAREPWLRIAIGCGLAGFLLACMIDFAMFRPGPAGLMWSLAAVAIASRVHADRPPDRPGRALPRMVWIAAAAGLAVALLGVGWTWTKMTTTAAWVRMTPVTGTSARHLLDGERVPWALDRDDPALYEYWADKLAERRSQAQLPLVRDLYDRMRQRDPASFAGWLRGGQARLPLAATVEDVNTALAMMAEGVRRNPTDALIRGQYGQALLTAGRNKEAAGQLRRAIALDDIVRLHDPKGLFHLSRKQREQFKADLLRAEAQSGPATRPAP